MWSEYFSFERQGHERTSFESVSQLHRSIAVKTLFRADYFPHQVNTVKTSFQQLLLWRQFCTPYWHLLKCFPTVPERMKNSALFIPISLIFIKKIFTENAIAADMSSSIYTEVALFSFFFCVDGKVLFVSEKCNKTTCQIWKNLSPVVIYFCHTFKVLALKHDDISLLSILEIFAEYYRGPARIHFTTVITLSNSSQSLGKKHLWVLIYAKC